VGVTIPVRLPFIILNPNILATAIIDVLCQGVVYVGHPGAHTHTHTHTHTHIYPHLGRGSSWESATSARKWMTSRRLQIARHDGILCPVGVVYRHSSVDRKNCCSIRTKASFGARETCNLPPRCHLLTRNARGLHTRGDFARPMDRKLSSIVFHLKLQ
jgi:hypothetical protein